MARKTQPAGRQLMIVESPTKARTIARFVGNDFEVLSSMGHIADLPRKGMSVDIENRFEPVYEVPTGKKKVLAELRKAAKGTKTVWLATDEDREGEAIAWHLARLLKLRRGAVRRIVFHEITGHAIRAALEEPREVDIDVVNAQQARRVLDRLVGYELSPVLWKKVRTGLSAGRVQSVAVRLVVEREREIEEFEPRISFKVTGEFAAGKGTLATKLDTEFRGEDEARAFLDKAVGALFTVAGVESKPGTRSPRPPYTTSTLQQEASSRLGFTVKQTMRLAQRLYEAGRITYMRTDSVNMSELALKQAAETVRERYGEKYVRTRRYKTRSKGAQEAHEAIRPTDFRVEEVEGERNEQRLYRLIWCRGLGSQMADAKVERTTVKVALSTTPERFVGKGEVVLFPGFLKVCPDAGPDAKGLPPLEQGQELKPVEVLARETFSRPPARFTEASLVKRLEELGIGRPSTYAPTISTIQDRGYVEKGTREGEERKYRVLLLKDGQVMTETRTEKTGADKGKLVPTDVAGVVTDFLVEHFKEVVDYEFTARVEEELDEVARGEQEWHEMVAEFYGPFHKDIEKAESLSRAQVARQRELGKDPKTGKPVSVRFGPYGPFVQLGTKDDEEKPRFASLRPGQKVETIGLGEALELLKLPRRLGKTDEGEEIVASYGRFGPYVKYGSKYVSIKDQDPLEVTLDEAKRLIKEKQERDAKQEILDFAEEGIKVRDGRYGPYVTDGKKNAKVPKGKDPAGLSLEECRKLLASARKGRGRKPAAGKPKAKKKPKKGTKKARKPAGKGKRK